MSALYCTFLLDGHVFGVPVDGVQEVLKSQQVTPVPLAPAEVSGLINLRGQIVTTIDLRTRLGIPPRDEGTAPVCVVVRTSDGRAMGLLVDVIGEVIAPEPESFEEPPDTVPAHIRELVTSVCKMEKALMLALDTERAVTLVPAA